MEYNVIELEFFDIDTKEQFKQLFGNNSGPFLETLFPWPAVKLHGSEIKPIDAFIWADQTYGQLPNPNPSQIIARREVGSTLVYTVITADWQLSYKSIRHLAFMFPIRRILLTHYNLESHVCIEEKNLRGRHKLNCGHNACKKYVLPRIYDFDWRHLPHPIYQVHETLDNVIKGLHSKKTFTENDFGSIYHHIIYQNTLFAIYENPVIKNARTHFEEQISLINNPYLNLMVYLDEYAPAPNITSSKKLESRARFVDGLFSQPLNRGYNTNPKRIRR